MAVRVGDNAANRPSYRPAWRGRRLLRQIHLFDVDLAVARLRNPMPMVGGGDAVTWPALAPPWLGSATNVRFPQLSAPWAMAGRRCDQRPACFTPADGRGSLGMCCTRPRHRERCLDNLGPPSAAQVAIMTTAADHLWPFVHRDPGRVAGRCRRDLGLSMLKSTSCGGATRGNIPNLKNARSFPSILTNGTA